MTPQELVDYWKERVSNAKHGVEEKLAEEVEGRVKKSVKKRAEDAAPYAIGAGVGILLTSLAFKHARR